MSRRTTHSFRPRLESLEDRIVPYVLSGSQWANLSVSASFMPDGTPIGTNTSNLFAAYDARYPTATWQLQFARALQTCAAVTPLNFHFVSDDGAPQGSPGLVQGDPRFGDIRVGAWASTGYALAYTYSPDPDLTIGGDVTLNSKQVYNIGTYIDLYSVVLHETGLALGLGETTAVGPVMDPVINGVYQGLTADDIAGIQAIYGARPPDPSANGTLTSATPLTLDSSGAVSLKADLSTGTDVDNYNVTVPAGLGGTLTVTVDPRALSLLIPQVSVYDAANNLVASNSATTYGSVVAVTLPGLVAGQTYTIQVNGATNDVFHVGAYQLTAQFGGPISSPPAPPPTGSSPGSQPPSAMLNYVANALAHSPEYYANFVTAAYAHYLGRTPAAAEVNHWVVQMQSGVSDERVEAGFIGSSEYIQNHGGGGSAWVQGLYQDLLGRTSSQAEVNDWVQDLAQGMSPAQVAYGFAASAEREAQRVTADYQKFLGRTPDASAVAGWVAAFTQGLSNEDVVAGFVGSAEYFEKHGSNAPAWLSSAYQDLLGRVLGAAEGTSWLALLAAGA
jgi:hypothetical protein